MWRVCAIFSLLLASLAWLYFLTSHIPDFIPGIQRHKEEFSKFPASLEDLKALTTVMSSLMDDNAGFSYVLVLFSSAYVFKQTFAIPGSVFLNLLAGAIFGLKFAFPLTCFLTACGATFCYLLAKFAGRSAAHR